MRPSSLTALAGLATAPALSVQPPYAWFLAAGEKRIENRTWRTRYRGWTWIHASSRPAFPWSDVLHLVIRAGREAGPAVDVANAAVKTRGAIIGAAYLVDVLDDDTALAVAPDQDFWISGPECWRFRSAFFLPAPVAVKGRLNLWSPPAETLAACLEQL